MFKSILFLLRLREEINQVLAEKTYVSYEDFNELKYCSAVFKESLRLWPPVGRIVRLCTDEMNINGVKIPSNTAMSVSNFYSGYMMARCE